MPRIVRAFLLMGCAGWAMIAVVAHGGGVPVFRQALESWPVENFTVTVFHRGAMEGEEQAAMETLRNQAVRFSANATVEAIDVADKMDDARQLLWQQQSEPPLPWVVVRAPGDSQAPPVWNGHLRSEQLSTLFDSPARRRIVDLLLQGEAAVWVLLESGDSMADESALDRLSESLRKLEHTLELPPRTTNDPPLLSPLPLRISFALVRVTRRDPTEEMFVNLLLHGDNKFAESTQPIAFPIFGRGRVLAGLLSSELRRQIIAETCGHLIGDTGGEGKEPIRGRSLLFGADWESVFKPLTQTKPSAVTPTISPALSIGAKSLEQESARPAGRRQILLAGFGALALLLGAGLWMIRSKSRPD